MRPTALLVLLVLLLGTSAPAAVEGEGVDGAIRITRAGTEPAVQGDAERFTGRVTIDSPFRAELPGRVFGASVAFEPGARTAWHSHTLGQTLIVTAGTGLVQRWGEPAEVMRQGDVVWIPQNVKHWHGAAPDAAMTHIAIVEHLDGQSTEWLELVGDGQYAAASPALRDEGQAAKGQSAAAQLFGDVAPKLVELTDEILFADVWERPQLSKRDRSLVTVAALVAMNRPDQLRFHLGKGVENGLSREELVEAITHLAFYAGWPSAVTAALTAQEAFGAKGAGAL